VTQYRTTALLPMQTPSPQRVYRVESDHRGATGGRTRLRARHTVDVQRCVEHQVPDAINASDVGSFHGVDLA
jgi:hypothetical protein